MPTMHRNLVRPESLAAILAFTLFPLANAQQPEPAITLVRPISAGSSLVLTKNENKATLDYREFTRAKVGAESEPEVFTLRFNQETKVTGISASADFHVTGGTCINGHVYSADNVCSVEVAFTPQGPGHRTGSLSVAHSASATPFLTPIGGTAYGPVVSFIPALIQTVPGTYSAGGTLLNPQGLAVDGGDSLYIADTGNNLVKFRDSSGAITSLVGGGAASAVGYSGFGSGIALNGPRGVAVDYAGTFYISDTGDSVVLVRYIDGIINTRIGGGATGSSCSFSSPCLPYNVKITPPYAIATDSAGNVYTTLQVGGSLPGFYIAENEADNNNYYLLNTTAYNYYTTSPSIAVDLYSNLYYTYDDPGGPLLSPTPLCYVLAQNRAYSTSAAGQRFWTVAGSGKCGFSGDGGKATGAEISTSIGQFAFDVAGNFYFADTGNNRIRRIDVASGVIRTVAGNGGVAYGGDGGAATNAQIHSPFGVAVDSMGQVYATGLVSATNNAVVRQVGTVGQLSFPTLATATHSAPQTILVSNTGNDTLNFIHFAITAGSTTEFAIDPNTTSCVLTLPLYSGKSCNIGVIFSPAAVGVRSAVLTILDDTITGSNTINLTGVGALPAKAALAPVTAVFSSQIVNTASAAQVLTLSNTGGLPLTISSYAFSGTNATDFTQTHTCAAALAGPGTCTISVVFKPIATGARSATLTVVTTAGTVTTALTGTGAAAPALAALSPTSAVFASQTINTASVAKAFTLSNTGGSPLTISSYTFSGTNATDFTQTHTCAATLAGPATCSISVVFKPIAVGARTATLTVVTTAGTVTAALTGTGAAAPALAALSPASSAFASQTVNTASTAKSFTLSNTGGSPLTITSYAISGTNATDFTQTHTCAATLAGPATCSVSVVFKPIAAGARSATLTIVTTGGTVTAALTGASAAPAVVPKVTLSSRVNPAADGLSVVLTSTVEATSSQIPTGKVQLMEGARLLAEADLNAGAVTFRHLGLSLGKHTLTASYLGDKLYKPSTSVPIQQTVLTGNARRIPIGPAPRLPVLGSRE